MISFKDFTRQKISYLVSHFVKNCVLLDYNGDQVRQIDLSFNNLSKQYRNYCFQQQEKQSKMNQSNQQNQSKEIIQQISSLKLDKKQLHIKINDKDLRQFWNSVTPHYQISFNMEGQNISDQSILKLAELFQNQSCRFSKLKLSGNKKISQVGTLKLGQSLRNNLTVKQINLHGLQIGSNGINRIIELIGVTHLSFVDLGYITNQSLKYLARNLQNSHHVDSIWFGQSTSKQKWKQDGKSAFQNVIRRCQHSKRIVSINVYPLQPIAHYAFISELNILTKKNRGLKVDQRENEFKAASLNPKHNSYYDPDNHNLNAYKFSVKSYLTNVFGSLLDEALYFLQKERRNQLRDQATFQITQQPTNKIILEDICTSDGSIIVLTKYLLGKIKEKQTEEGSALN